MKQLIGFALVSLLAASAAGCHSKQDKTTPDKAAQQPASNEPKLQPPPP
jgi:hypothetical protein